MGSRPDVRLPPLQLWIGGAWTPSESGATLPVEDPSTGELVGHVAAAGDADVDRACAAAEAALAGPWGAMAPAEREALLRRVGDLLLDRCDEIALLETLDAGKPIRDTRAVDVPLAARCFHYHAGWVKRLTGRTIPAESSALIYTVREPLGVVGALIPWNFPIFIAALKVAPALACGNTVVLKPSELAPLSCLALAEVCDRAGLPPGVLNVVPGLGDPAGRRLAGHPGVRGVTFTGGLTTARSIMADAAATVKKLSLELGGKSAHVIFPDADLDAAVEAACYGVFYNQGQSCVAGSRLLVHEDIADDFLGRLVERTRRLVVGDPFDPATELGPLISARQRRRVEDYVAAGAREGQVLLGGQPGRPGAGHYLDPVILTGLAHGSRLAQEEIFGPVLVAFRFRELDEVVRMANATPYGLAAGVWTRDVGRAHQLARRLQAGTVWVNSYGPFDHAAPFGGYKMSGFGREGGAESLEFYTQTKSVWVQVPR
jgi:acyl-CoA reductase-like NAD-dependent aldehyde dehydrogenase